MTNGFGTKNVPKDFRFENFLRQNLQNDKFEKIIYYDSCIIVKDEKKYGKIVICDDSIYSFVEAFNKFDKTILFKDIYSMELLNGVPEFIFGPMRGKSINIRIKYFKEIFIKTETPLEVPKCCLVHNGVQLTKNNSGKSQRDDSTVDPDDTGSTTNNNNAESVQLLHDSSSTGTRNGNVHQVNECIDFHILNQFSHAFHLLKKAHIDFLIRETLSPFHCVSCTNMAMSQTLSNRLFDDLVLDMTRPNPNDSLLELIESGHRYHRIKILFWSRPNLFEFLVTQFNDRWSAILADKVNVVQQRSEVTVRQLTDINVLLQVFNTFLVETDNLVLKSRQLRLNNGKLTLSLIRTDLQLIAHFNDCDQNSDLELDTEVDCLMHSITCHSVEMFYHLLCSSEVLACDMDIDPFSISTVLQLVTSLFTYDSSEGVFNKFVNQVLRMQFIWMFPRMYKFDNETLNPERVVSIFQFFSSMRSVALRVPKVYQFFRQEMEEEFEYFFLSELSFPCQYPISVSVLKLLKSFQKNMCSRKDVFTDYH